MSHGDVGHRFRLAECCGRLGAHGTTPPPKRETRRLSPKGSGHVESGAIASLLKSKCLKMLSRRSETPNNRCMLRELTALSAKMDILKLSTSSTGLLVIAALLFYGLYRCALPRPISDIPHNEESARRIMGDVPYFRELQKAGKRPRSFWAMLCIKKKSPIAQFFSGPFIKPVVVVADYREAFDLLTRRTKEVDRGYFNRTMWSGLVPSHFVGFDSKHPTSIQSKHLVKDVMSPNYIANVGRLPFMFIR